MAVVVVVVYSLVGQSVQHMDTEDHNQQTNGNDDEQGKSEPAENHSGRSDTAFDATIAQVLSYLRSCD